MALGIRQQRLYQDTFDVWKKPAGFANDEGVWALDPANTGIKGFVQNTPNYDRNVEMVGRLKEDNLFTSDVLHMELGVPVRSGDAVRVTLKRGEVRWYKVAGEVREKPVHANAQEAYILPDTPPAEAFAHYGTADDDS